MPQHVAAELREGSPVEVYGTGSSLPIPAKIVALDARIDPATRNSMVRARIDQASMAPSPGAAVRIRIAVGASRKAVAIPVNALRKGPAGDQVFVIEEDGEGKSRARVRRVESGAMLGDDIVIQGGLAAGERVAASGSFKLRDGVLVAAAGAPSPGREQDQLLTER